MKLRGAGGLNMSNDERPSPIEVLSAITALHTRSVMRAYVTGAFGGDACVYCGGRNAPGTYPLVGRGLGEWNGKAVPYHDHEDPSPHCVTCATPGGYDMGFAPWPCETYRLAKGSYQEGDPS